MSTSSINSLQSILSSALQNAGLSTTNNTNTPPSGLAALSAQQSDNGGLSPFAQLMNTLQQLQQSDPTKYQQVTQQIATNLQSAAQTAQTDGNTTLATQLSKLSTDFTNASTSGQLPNVQDLAKAVGGHHHHHGGHHAASSDTDGDSSTSSASSSTSSSASQSLTQLFSSLQPNGSQTDPLNPLNIILSTLSNVGITNS